MAHITQLQIYSTRHENLFKKILLQMLNDLSKFVLSMNRDKHGRVADGDLGVTLERLRAQLNNAPRSKRLLLMMVLSPLATPFFSCILPNKLIDRQRI
jgi:hypothetical protein